MTDVTIRIQGNSTRAGVLTVAPSGVVTHDARPVDERDVTVIVRSLTADGRAELAGRVQGWWWTFQGA